MRGESDENEKAYVESLFAEGNDNPWLRQYLDRDWNELAEEESSLRPDLIAVLDRVHSQMHAKRGRARTLLEVYMKVAAVLLLPVVALGFFWLQSHRTPAPVRSEQMAMSTIYAPQGARTTFQLPDGTRGMLNSGSSIKYSIPFTAQRKVTLEGEGWFDVAHDSSHPFEVQTKAGSIQVLGTRFNVNAYADDEFMEVVLTEGRVRFIPVGADESVELAPDERLYFRDDRISKTTVDPTKYTAWTEGKLVFRGDPMKEVVRRLERWYHVEIELADEALEEYAFFATFQDDTLEEVMKLLSMTSPISYKITPPELAPDGSVRKRRVTIFSKVHD